MSVELFVGTSGYSYKEWKGTFYPEDLSAKDMLSFYGQRLNAVEINNTFYRLPKASVLDAWAEQVPETFRFSIKASRRITHFARLKSEAPTARAEGWIAAAGPCCELAAERRWRGWQCLFVRHAEHYSHVSLIYRGNRLSRGGLDQFGKGCGLTSKALCVEDDCVLLELHRVKLDSAVARLAQPVRGEAGHCISPRGVDNQ